MTNDLFFDTDCISSFLWINNTNIITQLYGGKIVLPDPVYQELSNPRIPQLKKRIDILIKNSDISIKDIEVGSQEYTLYKSLINGNNNHKVIGKGEAIGIALAKVYGGILASNNHRDIDYYVDKYGLRQTDTATILVEALKNKIISEEEGNIIWEKMLNKNRKLPSSTFSKYISDNLIKG